MIQSAARNLPVDMNKKEGRGGIELDDVNSRNLRLRTNLLLPSQVMTPASGKYRYQTTSVP